MKSASITHRTIFANGIRMRLTEAGPTTGPVVLLAHGWPESWYSWRYQIPFLADAGYRVVAPDMRGFGKTDAPQDIDSYNILNLVEDLAGILPHCDTDNAVIVGHDWGALVAWHCALVHPGLFPAVAAMSVPHFGRPRQPPTRIWKDRFGDHFYYILYHQKPGVAELEYDGDPRGLLRMLYASPGATRRTPLITDPGYKAGGWIGRIGEPVDLPEWMSAKDLDFYVAQFTETGFRGGLNYYRNFDRNWVITENLDQLVSVPAMFIAGSKDLTIEHLGKEQLHERMSGLVPDLRELHWVEGAGHWIQQEESEICNRALLDFLKQQ